MKYHQIYRTNRKQMRWTDFDYSSQGVYFVTIVVKGRNFLFGSVVDDEMRLNEAGQMILDQYYDLEADNLGVQCMDVVVMPNHIHFMVYIPKDGATNLPKAMARFKSKTTNLYIQGVKDRGWQRFEGKLWQRSYWDVIVFNGREFEFIQRYIALNPSRWNKDAINDNHDIEVDDINGCIKKLKRL